MSIWLPREWISRLWALGDVVLGPLERMPRDWAPVAAGILTAALVLWLRRRMTDQQLLACIEADLKRLRELKRQHRRDGDREQIASHRRLRSVIVLMRLKQEWRPLAASIPAVLFIGGWTLSRCDAHPLVPGVPFEVRLWTPAAESGRIVYLLPDLPVAAEGGWIRRVEVVDKAGGPRGLATWVLVAPRPFEGSARFRAGDRVLEHSIVAGSHKLPPRVRVHGNGYMTEVVLRPLIWDRWLSQRMQGRIMPGLAAYLLGTLVAYGGIKKVSKIH